jgi:16S rRNA processing protein RimM
MSPVTPPAHTSWIELGRIGAPFGVKGWVHIDSHTDPPEGLLNYSSWVLRLASGERVARGVAESKWQHGKLVARFEDVADRDAAAALRGATIEIERSKLPPPREREYYRADLVGLQVRNVEGVELGKVRHFVDTPAGPLMVVQGIDGREHWVPAVPEYLRKVDLAAERIEVDWPVEFE